MYSYVAHKNNNVKESKNVRVVLNLNMAFMVDSRELKSKVTSSKIYDNAVSHVNVSMQLENDDGHVLSF